MKKARSIGVLLVVGLLLPAVFFAACSKKSATPEKPSDVIIAIISQNQGNPVFFDLEVGARDMAQKIGLRFEWYAPETGDSAKEAELIEAAANAGAHGVGIIPLDSTLTTTAQAVSNRGVFVCSVNGGDVIVYPELDFINGTPMFEIGYEGGKYALKYLTDKNKTYKIAMIQGQAGTTAFIQRMEGFEACLKENGVKFDVLAQLPCNDDFNLAGELVETFTLANPDLDMWFFSGGWPLFLDPQSMPEFKKWHDQPNHWLVTIDAFPPERAWFEAGLCEAAISQNYYRMGEMTVEYLHKLIIGEPLPPPDDKINNISPWYSTGFFAVTPENWQEEFAKMRPW